MNFRLSCLAAAVCAAAPFAVAAAPVVEEQEVVLVTATRTAQSLDEVLAPTVVITREQIERMQAVDLADVLRFTPASTSVATVVGTDRLAVHPRYRQ